MNFLASGLGAWGSFKPTYSSAVLIYQASSSLSLLGGSLWQHGSTVTGSVSYVGVVSPANIKTGDVVICSFWTKFTATTASIANISIPGAYTLLSGPNANTWVFSHMSYVAPADASSSSVDFTFNNKISFYMDAFQFEVAPSGGPHYPTPFLGYTKSRNASRVDMNISSCGPFSPSDLWIALRIRFGAVDAETQFNPIFSWNDNVNYYGGLTVSVKQGAMNVLMWDNSTGTPIYEELNFTLNGPLPTNISTVFLVINETHVTQSLNGSPWSSQPSSIWIPYDSAMAPLVSLGIDPATPGIAGRNISGAVNGDVFWFYMGSGELSDTELATFLNVTDRFSSAPFSILNNTRNAYHWTATNSTTDKCRYSYDPNIVRSPSPTPTPTPTPTPSPTPTPTCELIRGLNFQCSADTYTVTASSHSPKLHFMNYSLLDSFILVTTISVPDSSVEINGSVTVSGAVLEFHLQNVSVSVSGDLRLQAGIS